MPTPQPAAKADEVQVGAVLAIGVAGAIAFSVPHLAATLTPAQKTQRQVALREDELDPVVDNGPSRATPLIAST